MRPGAAMLNERSIATIVGRDAVADPSQIRTRERACEQHQSDHAGREQQDVAQPAPPRALDLAGLAAGEPP